MRKWDVGVPQHLMVFLEALPVSKWVSRMEILQRTGQSDYRRRIAQLRDEYGYDIEVTRQGGEWRYRRISENPVRSIHVRRYPSKKQRERVFQRDNFVCQLCLILVGDEQDRLNAVIDHKIPLIRAGNDEDNNLQTTCAACNIKKRQICANCVKESCDDCPLAFPEGLEQRLVLRLPDELMTKLEKHAKALGQPIEITVLEVLRRWGE